MHAFRFMTSVLVGPWRSSREEALDDAVRARQAVRSGSRSGAVEWRVEGRIERVARADRPNGAGLHLGR